MCNDRVIWNLKKTSFKAYAHLHSEPYQSEGGEKSLFIQNECHEKNLD